MIISIVMPVYNAEAVLRRGIDSILSQTNPNWELICVNDGSTDNSQVILEEYSNKDSRIKVFRKENSGPGMTRNYAMVHTTGDFIGFLDADDCWNVSCVDQLIKTVQCFNADVVFLRTMMCSNGQEKDAYNVNRFSKLTNHEIVCCVMSGILPWGQEKVVRASIIKENNLKYSSDPVGEEAIFSFEVLCRAKVIRFIDEPMYYYYVSKNGQHKLGNLDPWFNIVRNMKMHLETENLISNYKSSINSFALRALVISIYRICISDSYKIIKKKVKNKYLEYKKIYDLNDTNKISLDKKTKIVYWLLKNKFYLPIYLLSKYRNRNN